MFGVPQPLGAARQQRLTGALQECDAPFGGYNTTG